MVGLDYKSVQRMCVWRVVASEISKSYENDISWWGTTFLSNQINSLRSLVWALLLCPHTLCLYISSQESTFPSFKKAYKYQLNGSLGTRHDYSMMAKKGHDLWSGRNKMSSPTRKCRAPKNLHYRDIKKKDKVRTIVDRVILIL
ncbi:hypothetical protein PHYBLDRAFT_169424 [Phycomyces blakesleeanus NRRL 1555(-)]|uniref:Uncharacterized protein n=1 Tax=Phycomyces blakesleeanus (strain ATCC 8743b / DSM 1359 / FGSC 10004 / NBRC 33097 / NRRL 1555) TaxID=763407 RepID=A0A162X340_PHYB8|nr:hypothetical protein PHYBLDRAFT_169424 [Phycomyces blakesleeanus NRRL 1555(-)]OAD72285.1 hypothetical protein PHYBLDRAFT_169424 [Phycomyces blakesleeanus NRRL 1555(-)]|eukprot:XP_018290325.1 hypothetical protein PHYBLDRAFT_169424 [Phycomyces blakesleeanus NRRL 1555(-)]